MASGGPQQDGGRSMQASRHDLRMTAAEWDAFLDDVQHTRDTSGVPPAEQAELKALVASTRAEIVV
jgi:hemoglobin